jgi:hypothetical protein
VARAPGTAHDANAAGGDGTFADQLEHWLRADDTKTLGSLGDVFAEKAFAVTILLLMFLPALPLPTGGISHVFEGIVVVVASQMVLGRRTLWLPERWRRRPLGPLATDKAIPLMVRWVRRFERFSRPRGVRFFRSRWSPRVLGLLLIALAVTAAIAPPFSGLDTLPAMGAVAISLSIILEDVVLLGIGVVIGSGGAVIILTIGAAVLHLVRDLF